jgi:hypothetical protein
MLSGARGDEIGSRLIETAGKQSEPKFEGGATVQKDESPAGELAQSNEARLRKRGRRPGDERRAAIHEEIMKYGGGWRDHLGEIFEELDRKEIPLGNFYGKKVDLGDSTRTSVSKWGDLDLTHGKQRSQIVDVIRKYADNLISTGSNGRSDFYGIRRRGSRALGGMCWREIGNTAENRDLSGVATFRRIDP